MLHVHHVLHVRHWSIWTWATPSGIHTSPPDPCPMPRPWPLTMTLSSATRCTVPTSGCLLRDTRAARQEPPASSTMPSPGLRLSR